MTQVIPFNQSQGGNTANFCLANVCKGYGIPNKFSSAWQAWQNTEQHSGDAPDGLDVPVFFSYSATIDGTYTNWGHIGVRLSNGQFWSDGKIYSSIGAYTANHSPKYVGWGESINNVKVITGEEDMNVTQDQLNKICWLATGLQASAAPPFQNNLGNPLDTVLDNFMGYTETKNLHLDAEAYRAGATAPTDVKINGKQYVPKG